MGLIFGAFVFVHVGMDGMVGMGRAWSWGTALACLLAPHLISSRLIEVEERDHRLESRKPCYDMMTVLDMIGYATMRISLVHPPESLYSRQTSASLLI